MRLSGNVELHDRVVQFLQALAVDAEKELPGLPMGDECYNVDVPGVPVPISYSRYPGLREFRVTDVIWLYVGDDQ